MHLRSIVVTLLVTLLVACSSSSGTSGGSNGATCTSNAACAGGTCVVSADFPNGYCTHGCRLGGTDCAPGSVCIDDASGVPADSGISAICYASCHTSTDCTTPGTACLEKAGQLVCRNAR